MSRAKISAVLITKNEERNIKRCLDSLKWVDEIVVVDGESTDKTQETAKSYGAKVIEHRFTGDFGLERNIGNDNATGDWILALDADETIPRRTREKIEEILKKGSGFDAYNVPRMQYFLGKPLLHGGRYHSIINFFRKGRATFEGKVHHLVKVNGKIGQFEYPIEHRPFNNISEFIEKQNRYTRYEALEMYEKFKDTLLKEARHNLTFKPLKLFFKSYFKKKGYKDGVIGLVFCILFSWRHFLIWAKYWELCQVRPYNPAKIF
ncbi:MAG: glycosyltransferase family 2 protein [Candidatus Omnitrophota bacterium]|nr:MAG: glycosyltransferase family 2 protein [Candidatus Omnitrophota bacterium]